MKGRTYVATVSVKEARRGSGLVQMVFESPEPLTSVRALMLAQQEALAGIQERRPEDIITDVFFVSWQEVDP